MLLQVREYLRAGTSEQWSEAISTANITYTTKSQAICRCWLEQRQVVHRGIHHAVSTALCRVCQIPCFRGIIVIKLFT
jgi:hypothetical protein